MQVTKKKLPIFVKNGGNILFGKKKDRINVKFFPE